MCQFFSCISDGKGKLYYIKPEQRQIVYDGGELPCKSGANPIRTRNELDSHSAISSYFGLDCDKVNKYEFRPLDRKWTVDQINTTNDEAKIKRKVLRLDFTKIAPPELIFKPIFHPFKRAKRKRATQNDLRLLKMWDSVWDSVGDSVGDSVWDSVKASVGDSVGDSVWDSVWDSAGDSVGDSVWDSVRDSVKASVWGYESSFYNLPKWEYIKHKKGENPFQPCIDLWEKGLVPSFDGKTWRLHGYQGKVVKEISKEDLRRLT
jgi:hypothetical protein